MKRLDVPFIIVSGAIGEERAVESLKAGATDYVLKDRLGRLGQVVRREMDEAKERYERRKAEEAWSTIKDVKPISSSHFDKVARDVRGRMPVLGKAVGARRPLFSDVLDIERGLGDVG